MKKYLMILALFIAAFSGCKKDADFDATAQAAKDDAAIQAWIKANNVSVTKDASGLYYKIITPGTGAYPTGSSNVTVNYVGKLLNGTQFDKADNFSTSLTSVVRGWTVGLQHVSAGGSILLVVPSAMGYGNNDNGAIPANSVLVFNIDLLSVN